MTIRLDRLGKACFDALTGVADVVGWKYGEQNKIGGSLLAMSIGVGPAPMIRQRARSITYCPADSVTITVDAVTVGNRPTLKLNDFSYGTDVIGGDTVTTIRDRLLVKLLDPTTGELPEHVTAAANGANAIDLTAVIPGGLRSLFLVGQDLSHGDTAVFSGDAVAFTDGRRDLTWRLEAFGPKGSHEPRNGAWSIFDRVFDRLEDEDVVSAMAGLGVGVGAKSPPIDLSGIAGANFETRLASEVQLFTRSVAFRPRDHITTVQLNITVDGNIVAASATAP